MKSVVCNQPHELSLHNVDKPSPQAGEVLVKIRAIGVCGTDIHAYKGQQPYFSYPRVLGHELSGVIAQVGENTQSKVGQSVYIIPYVSCGECFACQSGKPNCCSNIEVIGVHRDGGMCEYIAVPESAIVVTDDLSFTDMALIECLAVGAHASRRAKINNQDTVLVLGAGPIGLGTAQFAQAAGARVFISEVCPDKIKFCVENYTFDAVLNGRDDLNGQLKQLTQGQYPNIIIDCTGNVHAMESAFYNLAHGGTIVFVSIVKNKISFEDPEFHKRETTLMGSRNATKEDFEYVVECIRKGLVKPRSFVTHTGQFDQITELLPKWAQSDSGVVKAVIEVN
ncbi:alcohol dehydrogenase GroES-like protein [Catenovulum agarivorans DS-2]|uniref:Alcohol dehydrogenase GroES-like protein n=1 Tax=Catenovulum agarivorans DS-2 TaxID=1328313 RepID=W7QIS5_9ALTE|nr:zinc-binding alcohol dehydrogenase family protein [Catenovulum agarivorans]EWH11756.1 alcohol dehydrogenase GroES-like protein [Catenovulum agarivorans DS-2]